jgi:hypothetical protein
MSLHGLEVLLRAAEPLLVAPLFSTTARERLHRLSEGFPALLGWGMFECRLSEEERVDFLIAPSKDNGGRAAVLEVLQSERGVARLGSMLPLLRAWVDSASDLHQAVPVIHFEYDLASDEAAKRSDPFAQACVEPDFPTLTAAPQSRLEMDVLFRSLFSKIPGYRLRDDIMTTMARCIDALPPGSNVVHVGVMPQRGRDAIRTVFTMPKDAIRSWLARVEWPGDYAALERLMTLVAPYWKTLALQCDVGEHFGPVLAIDYDEPSLSRDAPHWSQFMQRIVQAGVAREDKAAAALRWIGSSTHHFADLDWPLHVVRELDVKLVLGPRGDIEAKSYLGAYLGYTPYF